MREADEREEERAAAAEAEAEEAANARPTTQSQGFVAYGRTFIWQFKDEFGYNDFYGKMAKVPLTVQLVIEYLGGLTCI